jgi:hypothetical protein
MSRKTAGSGIPVSFTGSERMNSVKNIELFCRVLG